MCFALPPQLNDKEVAWSGQFPLLAPAIYPETPLSVFQSPYPGIGMALAMVAPEFERRSSPRSMPVRLLAVCPDGRFVARLSAKLYSVSTEDLEYLWRHCASVLACARKQPLPPPIHWALEAPMDCLQSLSDLRTYKFGHDSYPGQTVTSMLRQSLGMDATIDCSDPTDHDRSVQERLSSRFSEVVFAFLMSALDPDMLSLLVARPKLSFSTLYRLISLATVRGEIALRYMQGAIRTESLAILDLAAREDGKAVCGAIFEGMSLPKLLKQEFNMDGGIHRRTLVRPTAPKQSGTTNPVLADLPMSADTLLASLPVLKLLPYERWPRTHERWSDVFGLASELHNLDIDDGLKQSLLFWLLDRRMEGPSYYLYMFLDYCKSLCVAANNLAGMNMELREASSIAVDFMESHGYRGPEELLDTEEIGPTVVLVSTISGIDVNTLSCELFAKTPPVPEDFECAPYVIEPLHNINVCMEHGLDSSQCFKEPETAIHYGAGACALYKVSHWSGAPFGTIGCAYDDNSDPAAPEVGVWEVKGICNQTNVDIESLSAALAESFSRPEHLAKFAAYTEAVSAFRLLAGAKG